MKKITKRNYFSTNNSALSGSKIKDYLKDKHYFFKKHILGEIESPMTDALIIGSAVDTWLTKGEKEFRKNYYLVTRRTKSAPDAEYQLNPTMYDEVERICRRVEAQPAFQELNKTDAQKIIQLPMDLGKHFDNLCGMMDWLHIDGERAIITDLKTARDGKLPKYHYHCLEYGYYLSMAVYDLLVRGAYPEVKEVEHRHLVVEKDTNNINNVYTYILSPDKIRDEQDYLEDIFYDIKNENKFLPQTTTWQQAQTVGATVEDF